MDCALLPLNTTTTRHQRLGLVLITIVLSLRGGGWDVAHTRACTNASPNLERGAGCEVPRPARARSAGATLMEQSGNLGTFLSISCCLGNSPNTSFRGSPESGNLRIGTRESAAVLEGALKQAGRLEFQWRATASLEPMAYQSFSAAASASLPWMSRAFKTLRLHLEYLLRYMSGELYIILYLVCNFRHMA